jgi:hypothetical protein
MSRLDLGPLLGVRDHLDQNSIFIDELGSGHAVAFHGGPADGDRETAAIKKVIVESRSILRIARKPGEWAGHAADRLEQGT